MDNLHEVIERGWQVGFRHTFDSEGILFWETVGLQKWNGIYVVSINKIDEKKLG
jgi:hypothetical protein